jgi:hypothetical protein
MPWITPRGDLDYLRSTVKEVIRAAGLRDELSFTSFRHGGFTEGADADMSDAELRAGTTASVVVLTGTSTDGDRVPPVPRVLQ